MNGDKSRTEREGEERADPRRVEAVREEFRLGAETVNAFAEAVSCSSRTAQHERRNGEESPVWRATLAADWSRSRWPPAWYGNGGPHEGLVVDGRFYQLMVVFDADEIPIRVEWAFISDDRKVTLCGPPVGQTRLDTDGIREAADKLIRLFDPGILFWNAPEFYDCMIRVLCATQTPISAAPEDPRPYAETARRAFGACPVPTCGRRSPLPDFRGHDALIAALVYPDREWLRTPPEFAWPRCVLC